MYRAPDAGVLLRRYRQGAGLSQLILAADAGVSQRHLSFVETGRTRPSPKLLETLAGVLGLNTLDRNALLMAAGYAPARSDVEESRQAAAAMLQSATQLLEWQAPNPAMLLEDSWRILGANLPAMLLVQYFSRDEVTGLPAGVRGFDLIFDEALLKHALVNYDQIAAYMESQLEYDAPGVPAFHRVGDQLGSGEPQVALPVHLKRGDVEARFHTAIVTVGTLRDAHVKEIRMETLFAADDATRTLMVNLQSGAVKR